MAAMSATTLVRLLGDWRAIPGPSYAALATGIRLLVLDGRVPLGTRLPSERLLAQVSGVSRTTVTATYSALREQGWLVSRRGSGSVTTVPPSQGPLTSPGLVPLHLNEDLLELAIAAPPALPGVHQAYRAALERLPLHLPTSGYELYGLPELRALLAERWTARGLRTTPEQVLVTSGAQHALGLLIGMLVRAGDRVLVEHPTYPNILGALTRVGGRAMPIPVTLHSWDVDAFTDAVRTLGPRAAYVVPDFQVPTAHVLSDDDRALVTRLAGRTGMPTICDESLTDLWLDGPPPAPLGSTDPEAPVITVGGMAKSHWGGLRVGWLRGPASLVERLATERASVDLGTSVVEQLAAVELLQTSELALAGRREQLRQQRDVLLAVLGTTFREWEIPRPGGGLSVWARLDRPIASRLAEVALSHGLRLGAGPRFGGDGSFERFLRVPYTLPPAQLHEAVGRLAAAVAAVDAGAGRRGAGRADAERPVA